ncbi:MAG: hypothetical protein U0903_19350 [Planctomycetales bacterium]
MRHRLRLYTGEEETTTIAEPQLTVTLGEISNILAEAVNSKRAWLNDFEDDRIQVSSDLYEVLTTYWRLRPGA